jgi:hypothetical protein
MLAEPIFQICSASVVPEEMKKAKKRGTIFGQDYRIAAHRGRCAAIL